MMGVVMALMVGNAYAALTSHYTSRIMAYSIIGLGAGMNLETVIQAGMAGIGYTTISIAACIGAGLLIGRLLKTDREASLLITVGTAICGGSAIAAIAPVINARPAAISIALAVVFILNAVALFLFPWIGRMLDLTQYQFGLWVAIAIHDTSSVVGAAMQFGTEALETATTVKLARALWIVPLVFAVQYFYTMKVQDGTDTRTDTIPSGATPSGIAGTTKKAKRKYPWFILGFIGMAAFVTYMPALRDAGQMVAAGARQLLVFCLFLIGAGMTRATLKAVGFTALLQGVALWAVMAGGVLVAIKAGWMG